MHKRALQMLFGFILVSLTVFNLWASTRQSVLDWGGLTTSPDNLWTIAAFIDAFYGFVTFFMWVLWKETRVLPTGPARAATLDEAEARMLALTCERARL